MDGKMTKEELKEIINPLFKNLSDEIKHLTEMFTKDIKRLDGQSAEHYANAKALEKDVNNKIEAFKRDCETSQTKQGQRIGTTEQQITAHETEIENIQEDIKEKSGTSKWKAEMWIILIIAILGPVIANIVMNM